LAAKSNGRRIPVAGFHLWLDAMTAWGKTIFVRSSEGCGAVDRDFEARSREQKFIRTVPIRMN